MNDYNLFREYKSDCDVNSIIINEMESQLAYMNDIARNNVEEAVEEDKIPLSYYWNGFGDITDAMMDILTTDDEIDSPEFRRERLKGMIDACNMILTMVEEDKFCRSEDMCE